MTRRTRPFPLSLALLNLDRDLMRILLSLALGVQGSPLFVSPWWLAFTAFVGLNLFQYAFTNICPLGFVLRKLGVKD